MSLEEATSWAVFTTAVIAVYSSLKGITTMPAAISVILEGILLGISLAVIVGALVLAAGYVVGVMFPADKVKEIAAAE